MPTYRNDSTSTVKIFGEDIGPGQSVETHWPIYDVNFTLTSVDPRNGGSIPVNDIFTGLPVYMTDDHTNVHLGMGYSAWRYGEIANNAYLDLEFKTPTNSWIHLKKVELWAEGLPHIFSIVSSPTLTTGATPFVPRNRNFNSPFTSRCTLKTNPTGISGGTIEESYMFGGGVGVGATSSATTRSTDLEVVMKPNTTYLIRCQNTSGAVANMSMWVFWYEESYR